MRGLFDSILPKKEVVQETQKPVHSETGMNKLLDVMGAPKPKRHKSQKVDIGESDLVITYTDSKEEILNTTTGHAYYCKEEKMLQITHSSEHLNYQLDNIQRGINTQFIDTGHYGLYSGDRRNRRLTNVNTIRSVEIRSREKWETIEWMEEVE